MENNSFTVLPMTHRFNLEPGKVYEGYVSVINPSDAEENLKYIATVSPYGVTDESYSADLVTETNRTQIAKWIMIEEPTGEIKPNEKKDIKFTIAVPEDAAGGGQYAAIAIGLDNDVVNTEGVMVGNVFELASLIYANVSGNIKHSGEIIENNIPGFVLSAPITLSALITNEGNVHEDATFLITVSNVFTGEVILPTEEVSGQYNELIMPETTREVTRQIDGLPSLGVMNITQTIYYRGNISEVSRNVIICPLWFLILVLATITAIIWTVVGIIFRHRHKRREKISV